MDNFSYVNKTLASRLRELRGKTSLNQIEKETGFPRRMLKYYEDGERVPTDDTLEKLSSFYNVSFSDLKELQLADMFPEGSRNREVLFNWVLKLTTSK